MLRTIAKRILPTHAVEAVKAYIGKSRVIVPGPVTYSEDGLTTQRNCDFVTDPLFAEAYRLAHATGSWKTLHLRWRVHTACWAARVAMHLDGDFVECGTNRGGLARAITHYVSFERSPKQFYLLDTFCGLVEDQITPEERARGIDHGDYPECYEAVRETFRQFANVHLVRGMVPDTLAQVPSERVAFLSIDMNCALPEIAAAEFFWPKLSAGAIVLLDDYGAAGHEEQKYAFDEFAVRHGVAILSMPTGQGVMLKPH